MNDWNDGTMDLEIRRFLQKVSCLNLNEKIDRSFTLGRNFLMGGKEIEMRTTASRIDVD